MNFLSLDSKIRWSPTRRRVCFATLAASLQFLIFGLQRKVIRSFPDLLLFAAGAALVPVALAQNNETLTLKEAAQAAVQNNPEVLLRFHNARAADGERTAAQGGLYPRVDFTAGARREPRNAVTPQQTSSGPSVSVSLSQLLYDGFATANDVKRLDYLRRMRIYEFLDASESIALEASRAYLDVLRFRELVGLAEENYVQHRSVFTQTESRVNARVARGVDLEQISGRLALAEANLLTETSNLHDTTARFQRLVGRLPPAGMQTPALLDKDIPADAVLAVRESQLRNGTLLAAIENVRSANAALDSRRGAFGPRIDFRLRRDRNGSTASSLGSADSNVAEVVLNWNVFSGGADQARLRQLAEQLNSAKDLRDKACRDTRQTLLIAYNDTRKLKEQIAYLDRHKVSIERARNAYRQQFDIGQRTLLDLLDTENELFQARRAVANAEHDLILAYVRTHAGLGTLIPALELSRKDIGALPERIDLDEAADISQQCPQEPIVLYAVDKKALDTRADELLQRRRASGTGPGSVVGGTAERNLLPLRPTGLLPADTSAKSSTNSPLTPASSLGVAVKPASVGAGVPLPVKPIATAEGNDIQRALERWRMAWMQRDLDAYLASYAPGDAPTGSADRKSWEAGRRTAVSRAAGLVIEISDLETTQSDPDRARTRFKLDYRSANYQDSVIKTLEWIRIGANWKIALERSQRLTAP